MTTLYIKNMVCNRCIMVVKQELENEGLHPERVSLGEVILKEDQLTDAQQTKLDLRLKELGFERIDDRKARLIEAIKNKVINMIHHTDKVDMKFNWSTVLADELHYEYNYLSNLFSSVEGITLEQYIIRQKIEKVKEWLAYDEMPLKEMAYRLGYSSTAHLSNQFKQTTGMSPAEFRRTKQHRTPLDEL